MHASHAPPFEKCSFHAIATQNGRIFLKEAERSKPVVIDSHDDLTDFERTLRHWIYYSNLFILTRKTNTLDYKDK